MVSVNPQLRVEDEISESFYMWIIWDKFWSYFVKTTQLNSWSYFVRVTVSNYSVILHVIAHQMCNCDTEICL